MTTALDLYEATPEYTDGLSEFDHNGMHIILRDRTLHSEMPTARFTCAIDHPDAATMYQLAHDYIETYLSETTNNDACLIRITEQSAHFKAGDQNRIEVHVEILDYLT